MGLNAGKEARLGRTSHFCGPDCEKASKATGHQRRGHFKVIQAHSSTYKRSPEEVSHSPKRQSTMMASLTRKPGPGPRCLWGLAGQLEQRDFLWVSSRNVIINRCEPVFGCKLQKWTLALKRRKDMLERWGVGKPSKSPGKAGAAGWENRQQWRETRSSEPSQGCWTPVPPPGVCPKYPCSRF